MLACGQCPGGVSLPLLAWSGPSQCSLLMTMRSLASVWSQKRKRFFKVSKDIKDCTLRNYAFIVIVGETPIKVTKNNIVSVIPSWGPIYEFTFDMRINKMPEGYHNIQFCKKYHRDYLGVGMIMRLGADGPTSDTRTSLSMAPIVFLGSRQIFVCIHNKTNPNEAKLSSSGHATDVCGDMCVLEQESFIGIYPQGLFYVFLTIKVCVWCLSVISCHVISSLDTFYTVTLNFSSSGSGGQK